MDPGTETSRGHMRLQDNCTPWPRKVKLKRLAWTLFQATVFRCGVKWIGGEWRATMLRMWGAKIGRGTVILPTIKVLQPWMLELGDYSTLAEDVEVYNFVPIKIGDQTVISQRVFLCTGSHDYEDPTMPLTFKPITIGSECWVAAEAFVGPGVTIGDRTVVGARAVVVRDLPSGMVCAGHPCKPLKPRHIKTDDEIVRDYSIYQQ